MSLNFLDYAVIAAYVVGCLIIGARIGAGAAAHGLKGYFLGESNIPAWAVMISIVAIASACCSRGYSSKRRIKTPPSAILALNLQGPERVFQ